VVPPLLTRDRARFPPTASCARRRSATPLTVGIRPGLLASARGVPPGGSGGNLSGLPSSPGRSHARASLASSTRLLSSVIACLLGFGLIILDPSDLSTPN